jgi:hypothetical protein
VVFVVSWFCTFQHTALKVDIRCGRSMFSQNKATHVLAGVLRSYLPYAIVFIVIFALQHSKCQTSGIARVCGIQVLLLLQSRLIATANSCRVAFALRHVFPKARGNESLLCCAILNVVPRTCTQPPGGSALFAQLCCEAHCLNAGNSYVCAGPQRLC